MTDVYTHPAPVTPVLRTKLLSETISELHLKPDAPYPTELKATLHSQELFRDYIQKFRRSQEHVTLKEVSK